MRKIKNDPLWAEIGKTMLMGCGLVAIILGAFQLTRKKEETPDRFLEIYTAKDIYYVDVDKLEIQTHGSDSVFFFSDFDKLGFWLSDKTDTDAVDVLNIAAYQEYVRCSNQGETSDAKEWGCYQEYIKKLVVKE